MEELIKKLEANVEDMFGKTYNRLEFDNLISDSLDLFIYRFVRNEIVVDRHSTMTAVDTSEYIGILKEADEILKMLKMVVDVLEGRITEIKDELGVFKPFEGLFQYLFTNYNLEEKEFKKGFEDVMNRSFKELTDSLEHYIFTYLKIFYYVVSKRYYYVGGTTQVILDGVKKSENASEIFKRVIEPSFLIKSISKIIKGNKFQNLNDFILNIFESFYKKEKGQVANLFPIQEIEFNDTDVQLLLGEDYLTRNLDENVSLLKKGVKGLVDSKGGIFLNELKNEKINQFTANMGIFACNLRTFTHYFCDNCEVYTKTILLSFDKVFKGVMKDPMIIPDYINIEKIVRKAESMPFVLDTKQINTSILTSIINSLRSRFKKDITDEILISTFNIIFSVLPYYKLTDILAELKFSQKIRTKYFKGITSLSLLLEENIAKVEEAQSVHSESSRFKHKYMTQFEIEEEEETLEEEEEFVINTKKQKLPTPEKISNFEAQNLDSVIKRNLDNLVNKLSFIAMLIQYPRKTKQLKFSKALYEEAYVPILESRNFKTIGKQKIKALLKATNMMFSYSNILGSTSILTISGKRDYLYLNRYKEYMVKKAESSALKNIISEDLFKELGDYLAGANRMTRAFFEIGKVHADAFLKNLDFMSSIKIGEPGWSSYVKRYSEAFNKSLEVLLRDVGEMSGQSIINTILIKAEKEFEKLEKNYIIMVNDMFFHSLIDKL